MSAGRVYNFEPLPTVIGAERMERRLLALWVPAERKMLKIYRKHYSFSLLTKQYLHRLKNNFIQHIL